MSIASSYSGSEYKISTDGYELSDIDATGCMPMFENNLRTLLIQCPCCNMYKLPDNAYTYLNHQYLNGFPPVSMSTCKNCIVIAEQIEAIDHLNDQIHELVVTVDKLRNIREIEKEIEMSFNCLTPLLDQEYRDVKISDISNDEHDFPLDDSQQTDNTTDRENIIKPCRDEGIDEILHKFSKLNVTEHTNAELSPNHLNNFRSDKQNGISTEKSYGTGDKDLTSKYITIDEITPILENSVISI